MLHSPECPLAGDSLERAKRNFAFVQARGVFRHLKRGRFDRRWRSSGTPALSAVEWIRYLRPPRRSADRRDAAER